MICTINTLLKKPTIFVSFKYKTNIYIYLQTISYFIFYFHKTNKQYLLRCINKQKS